MNQKQKWVLICGATLVVLQCSNPPWYIDNRDGREALANAAIWAPPEYASGVDLGRLLPGLIAAIAVTAVLYMVCRSK